MLLLKADEQASQERRSMEESKKICNKIYYVSKYFVRFYKIMNKNMDSYEIYMT